MVYSIPDSWVYNKDMEMLWYFYQNVDEMLSTYTIDTFSVPLHNTLTLFEEMNIVYSFLSKYGMLDKYYTKYIDPIIDEFLYSLVGDSVLKKMLGERLSRFEIGLKEAKGNPALLPKWLHLFMHDINEIDYYKHYQSLICSIVKNNKKEKKRLTYCLKVAFAELLWRGYNREFLYQYTKRFFDNKARPIDDPAEIEQYWKPLDFSRPKHEFLISMDISEMEYLDSISENHIMRGNNISVVDDTKELDTSDYCVNEFLKNHEHNKMNGLSHSKMAIVKYVSNDYDEYSAIQQFDEYTRFLHVFSRYFKHYSHPQIIKEVIYKQNNEKYRRLKIPALLLKRPFVEQVVIDKRVQNIMSSKAMSFKAADSIFMAMQMHSEALDARELKGMARSFWAALETLFLEPRIDSGRKNVENSLVPIIQKTYLLKVFRSVYADLRKAISTEDLFRLQINSFKSFIEFFAVNDISSEQMKLLFSCLEYNPLLRTRIYSLRETLGTGRKTYSFLAQHEQKVRWQIKRLQRTRNIATHIGEDGPGIETIVNHMHNYFDYVINYSLCKMENDSFIFSISSIVDECELDNSIQMETLKTTESLSGQNYQLYLFGPDLKLMDFEFELGV